MKLRSKERNSGEKDLVGSFAAQTGKYGILILMVALVVLFSALRPESFATFNNYRAILDNRTIVALLALAAMTPLIVGQFDLSIAAVLSLSHILVVGFIGQSHMNVVLAVVLTIILSSMYGLINGVIVVKFKVDAFVATLATGSILGGAGLWYTGGRTLYNDVPRSFTQISRGRLFGLPLNAVYVLIIATILWVFLSNLPAGRRMYATGGNRRAAELTGTSWPHSCCLRRLRELRESCLAPIWEPPRLPPVAHCCCPHLLVRFLEPQPFVQASSTWLEQLLRSMHCRLQYLDYNSWVRQHGLSQCLMELHLQARLRCRVGP